MDRSHERATKRKPYPVWGYIVGWGKEERARGGGRQKEDNRHAQRAPRLQKSPPEQAGGYRMFTPPSTSHDAAVVQCSPREGPRGGCVEPAAGQVVSFGVEGGEVAAGAEVVLRGEPGFVHAEGGGEKGRPVWDGEGGSGGRATGEVAELGGGGVGGEKGLAGPAVEGEQGDYLGDPLGLRGVAGEGVEAKPAAVECAVVGVSEGEFRAEAGSFLAAIACDHHVGEGPEGGQRAGVVLRGGAYEQRGEDEDCDIEGGEGSRQGGPLGEP